MTQKPEFWLDGPIPEIPPLLQPSAHGLLQANREVQRYLTDFPENLLWEKPFGRAAVGFHLRHLTGVLDRMLTYAKGNALSKEQFIYLKDEGNAEMNTSIAQLINAFDNKIAEALAYFKSIDETTLTDTRTVGRKKLPTTVIGLLFHAAEHSQRHVGQLLVTVSALTGGHNF